MRSDLPADATIPRLLLRNAQLRPGAAAMREKSMGIWRTLSWSDYYGMVREFALGLAAIGFKRGDVLAVIGDNRPRLYAAQIAAQCLGATPAPLYQDAAAEELVYVLDVNEERGTTVILIEHDMGVVMDVSKRVVVLDRGRVIAEGDPQSVQSNPEVIRAYLGTKRAEAAA